MGVPVVTVTCGGQPLDPTIELLEVEVHRELNRVPEARLVLLDGSVARQLFQLSDSDLFAPGKQVGIALRYEGDREDRILFEGLVVRHGVEAEAEGSVLRVELKDKAFKLTRQRKSAVFRDQSDDAAIRTLIDGAGIQAGALPATQPVHKELIQYYASDWDFIVLRADVQGLVVDVHRGKLSLVAMAPTAPARRTLEYGTGDLLEFGLEIDGSPQWAEVASTGWDVAGQQLRAPEQATQPNIKSGNIDASKVAQQLGGDQYNLLDPIDLDQAELKAWANARLLRSRLALLRGRLLVEGDPALAPLDTVELARIGDRFNGPALVSAVTNRVGQDGWTTELRLGLSPDWFARKPDIAAVPAGGLLPPITGLQIAKVAPFEKDPLGEHRVKLKLPALDERQGFVWARVAHPDAGPERGFLFWPEPEDEVVVGFLNGDPRQAVLLGALHGSKQPPSAIVGGPSETNFKRGIVSRTGAVVGFDDDKVQVKVATPGGQTLLLDDDDGAITISDQHGNRITLSKQGIELQSASELTIAASGKVVIKGSTVDVQ